MQLGDAGVWTGNRKFIWSGLSALSDTTLNDDDGLPILTCAKCKRRVESLEHHTEVAEGHEKSLAENPNFHYTPLYYPDKFTISSPNSDVT